MDHYNLQKLYLIAATCRGFNLVYIFVLSCKGYFSLLSHSYNRNGYLLLSRLTKSFNLPHVEHIPIPFQYRVFKRFSSLNRLWGSVVSSPATGISAGQVTASPRLTRARFISLHMAILSGYLFHMTFRIIRQIIATIIDSFTQAAILLTGAPLASTGMCHVGIVLGTLTARFFFWQNCHNLFRWQESASHRQVLQ